MITDHVSSASSAFSFPSHRSDVERAARVLPPRPFVFFSFGLHYITLLTVGRGEGEGRREGRRRSHLQSLSLTHSRGAFTGTQTATLVVLCFLSRIKPPPPLPHRPLLSAGRTRGRRPPPRPPTTICSPLSYYSRAEMVDRSEAEEERSLARRSAAQPDYSFMVARCAQSVSRRGQR